MSGKKHRLNIEKILKEYGEQAVTEAIKEIKDGSGKVLEAAFQNCPMAAETIIHKKGKPALQPGTLKNSIHLEEHLKGKKPYIDVVCDAKNPHDGVAYGYIIEHKYRPFMYTAFDRYKDEIMDGIVDALRRAAQK